MPTPERNLWNRRPHCPDTQNKGRNRAGSGIPDVHVCADKTAFWVELKCIKGDTVSIRPRRLVLCVFCRWWHLLLLSFTTQEA